MKRGGSAGGSWSTTSEGVSECTGPGKDVTSLLLHSNTAKWERSSVVLSVVRALMKRHAIGGGGCKDCNVANGSPPFGIWSVQLQASVSMRVRGKKAGSTGGGGVRE